MPGTSFPASYNSISFLTHILHAISQSSEPGKNTKTSPGPSCKCILIAAVTASSTLWLTEV